MNAQEAYEKSFAALAEQNISSELEQTEARIEEAASKGYLSVTSPAMSFLKAERLALYFENKGFSCGAHSVNIIKDGLPQAYVSVSWKYLPHNSRESHQTI